MKVYVAGSSQEMPRAKQACQWLKQAGITVTSTWIEVIEKDQDEVANPRDASKEQRAYWARQCLNEVKSSDVFWLLAPNTRTSGAWYEGGAAFIHHEMCGTIPSVISGDTKQSIFCALGHEFETDLEAFQAINRMMPDLRSKSVMDETLEALKARATTIPNVQIPSALLASLSDPDD